MFLIFLRTLQCRLCSVWVFVLDSFPFIWTLRWVHFLKVFLQLESLHDSHEHLCIESNITDHRQRRLKRRIFWLAFWMHWPTSRKVPSSIPDVVSFLLIQSFRSHYGPGIDSVSNRNVYQEYFLGGVGKDGRSLGLTYSPPSCLEIWETESSGALMACPGL
jgi:hypothetical protein